MYDKRKEELKKIKAEKLQEINRLEQQIQELQKEFEIKAKEADLTKTKLQQLTQKLRVIVDQHNQAAWILEEYEALEQKQGDESKLKLVKGGKSE